MNRLKSLTLRIWITFVIFVVIIISAISLIYLTFVRSMEEANTRHNLEIGHETLLQVMAPNTGFIPNRMAKPEFKNIGNLHHMVLKSEEGVLADSFPLDRRMEPPSMPSSSELAQSFFAKISEADWEKQVFKATIDQKQYYYIISSSSSEVNQETYLVSYILLTRENTVLYFVIGIGFAFIGIALIVSKVISNYISGPLKQLQLQTEKIANKEWVTPMTPSSNDEIGSLIKSINNMQLSLRQADQEERRFLQSISHDLKTPIMVILSHAEAIKDGIYIDSLENTAEIIKTEALNLESKVKQILYFNTLDYALDNEQNVMEIDLMKLLNYNLIRFKAIKPELDWQLTLQSAIVTANSERLQVAIENILENQLRYAKDFIRVELEKNSQFAILHISNNGPALSEEAKAHIFKSFYKGEKGHFGLGLAITSKIISFYGGAITVENTTEGVSFTLTLPLSHPSTL